MQYMLGWFQTMYSSHFYLVGHASDLELPERVQGAKLI